MKVEQIYELTNKITEQVVGDSVVLQEDLSNVVDVGEAIFDSTSVDNYVRELVDHIGKVVFVNRAYAGNAPSVLMDGWEYGSVLQKVKAEMPEARVNESWELEDGKSYDPNIFYKPKVSAKFFNSKTTFEVDVSFTEMQVKESFSSAEQLNGFISMLTNEVEKAMTIRLDALIKSTINSMTADTLYDAYGKTPTATDNHVRAVNLLDLYRKEVDSSLTSAKDAITTPEFIRFAALKMKLYVSRLSNASSLFNMGGNVRFTSDDYLHVIMLSEFREAASVYLQSDTYNEEFTSLPNSETVPYWQGSGTDFSFESTSRINVKSGSGHHMETDGILAVMFDRDALGVSNLDRRVKSQYNPKAEFYNNFYKADAGYFNDGDENFVVFYVKGEEEE